MLIWLNSSQAAGNGFIFLDRDGIINENRPDYVKNIREFRAYPDALLALELLNRKKVSVIVISNQSGINRGFISWDDFWEMHDGMIGQVEQSGGSILATLYCPHRPDELCGCRKPFPAMVLAACRLYGIESGQTYFIGDLDTDVEVAKNAGCKAIQVRRDNGGKAPGDLENGVPVFGNLLDAVLSIYS